MIYLQMLRVVRYFSHSDISNHMYTMGKTDMVLSHLLRQFEAQNPCFLIGYGSFQVMRLLVIF